MAASTRNNAAWERVLAAIEADAARAAALLVSDDATAQAGIDFDSGLPVGSAASTHDDMSAGGAGGVGAAGAAGGAGAAGAAGDAVDTSVPATWRLPTNQPGAESDFELPNVEDMPPIPTELRERIERLRTRINALQRDLASAMAEARLTPRPVRIPTPESRPGYVDRKL